MKPSPPSFLRVHRGPENNAANDSATQTATQTIARSGTRPGDSKSGSELLRSDEELIHQYWDSFASTTGWRLAPRSRRVGESPELTPVVNASSSGNASLEQLEQLIASESTTGLDSFDADDFDAFEETFVDSLRNVAAVGKSSATTLAASAIDIISELQDARGAVRRAGAEMAARASVIASPDQQATLADRIETILSDVVAATDCTAALVFTLDDDTSVLTPRSVFGMSPRVLQKEPLSLQGRRGDLEAMIKGVVTIDDLGDDAVDGWNAPEDCRAAICAVICSGDVPIGTMWILADETKSFGDSQAASARMAARAIGVELTTAGVEEFARPAAIENAGDSIATIATDFDPDATDATTEQLLALEAEENALIERMLADNFVAEKMPPEKVLEEQADVADLAAWQFQSLPIGANLATDWKVDGMIDSPRDFAIGWHLWDILPDGSIAFAIAEACEAEIAGAMSATVARASLASHLGYPHSPQQLLARVADTLWQTVLGEQWMSMLYASVDPDTGEGLIASAGHISAIIGSRRGYRPVLGEQAVPLCMDIDPMCVHSTFRMMPGETLLAYTQGFLAGGTTHSSIGSLLHQSLQADRPNPLASIRKALASIPKLSEQGAATLVRL